MFFRFKIFTTKTKKRFMKQSRRQFIINGSLAAAGAMILPEIISASRKKEQII